MRYRVLAPHLHGYGRSPQRASYSVTYYRDDAADMLASLDILCIDQVLLLGFSDGAIVGLLLAALHPQRVKALAVLGAQPSINARDVAAIRRWLLEAPLSEEWQAQLEKTCRQGFQAAESGRGCALSIGVRSCLSRRALRA